VAEKCVESRDRGKVKVKDLWESNEEQMGDWDEAQQRLEVYTPKR
jgi:hypothetical protein